MQASAFKMRIFMQVMIKTMPGENDVKRVQVPAPHFTTWGVSPRRDVDYRPQKSPKSGQIP
jgi:hypothetical protein